MSDKLSLSVLITTWMRKIFPTPMRPFPPIKSDENHQAQDARVLGDVYNFGCAATAGKTTGSLERGGYYPDCPNIESDK